MSLPKENIEPYMGRLVGSLKATRHCIQIYKKNLLLHHCEPNKQILALLE